MADDGGDNNEGPPPTDNRWEFLQAFALRSMNLKNDKWSKMLSVEDNRLLLSQFLDGKDVKRVIITLPATGALTPQTNFPKGGKNKSVYFIKRLPNEPVKKEKLGEQLLFGDISAQPLEQLANLVEEVVAPVLTNPENYAQWPKVVAQDVHRHVHQLRSDVFVTSGAVKGETLLPLPVGADRIDTPGSNALAIREDGDNKKTPVDRELIHRMQNAVIEWASLIKEILLQDSAHACIAGKNPTPMVEINFWEKRQLNLHSIYRQLTQPKVRKLATVLKMIDSTYYGTLYNLFLDVKLATTQAQDIIIHLKPMSNILDEIENTEFEEICEKNCIKLQSLMEIVGLVWSRCKSYQNPLRMVVLLQEICNMLIDLARNFLDPENILKGEIDETLAKILTALKVLKTYKQIYFDTQARLGEFFENGDAVVEWTFAPVLVFARFDNFVKRLDQMKDFFVTANEYLKLEKVEFGGVAGGALSLQVLQLYEEFNSEYRVFTERTYDPMDFNDDGFTQDYRTFKKKIEDFDRRLAKCACLGFNDCANVEGQFKLLAIFGDLVKRPLIAVDFDEKFPELLETYDLELDTAKKIYDYQLSQTKKLGYAPVHSYQPPVAGQLEWARELRLRIQKPREQLILIDHPSMSSEQAELLYKKYDKMLVLIAEFEERVYSEWVGSVDKACSFNQDQPILIRGENDVLSVNFDRALTTVLREVRYLKYLKRTDIPESAANLFQKNDFLRQLTQNLDRTVNWYNKVRKTLSADVEFPIVKHQLEEIDEYLKESEKSLYWSGEGVGDYAEKARDMVHDLEKRIQKTKDNLGEIETIMRNWCKAPLYERRVDQKNSDQRILDIVDREDKVKKRYLEIEADGEKLHKLLEENAILFKANVESEEWHNYQDFVDKMLIDGLDNAIKHSLEYLISNMENEPNLIPLFNCKYELQHPAGVFVPSLDQSLASSFQCLVTSVLDDIFKMASLVKRVAFNHQHPHYVEEMEEIGDLVILREEIIDRVQAAVQASVDYVTRFEQYSYLWLDDREEFKRQFLTYGKILTPEDIDAHAGEQIPESPPTTEQFKDQIDLYEDLYVVISKLDETKCFDGSSESGDSGWFRVYLGPFKQALLNRVKLWSYMFKDHIVKSVEDTLADLDDFIAVTNNGLTNQVPQGDYESLVDTMKHLGMVRDRAEETDVMFVPIKEKIDLLKSYNHEEWSNKDEVYKLLNDLPDTWASLKKTATQVKQTVAPLQADEVGVIRRHCATFDVGQHEFREKFRDEKFFKWDCPNSYPLVFSSHLLLQDKEEEMEVLSSKAGLFEVNIPEFKQLKTCRKELVLVKQVWDLANIVNSSIDEWKMTAWKGINVEAMENSCKAFGKQIRLMDKEVRAWDVFTGLDSTVRNMLVSFQVIVQLQDKSVRDRHWYQLMQLCKVKFVMNDETTLESLLKLNLHAFADEVGGIVEKARKEMTMEKTLDELAKIWGEYNFDYDEHSRTGIKLLRSDEELVETLEENQVQIQGMITNKYIGHFLEEVSKWSKKLSITDSVMNIMFEVQRTWSHLESIFIGSDDIRKQLPADSDRFDQIDQEFKDIMKAAAETPNVVECTNKPGLYEQLEKLQNMLTVCEKALQEYLETKRLAFPRFYFVSSSDLLDILSNGTQPLEVCKHLEKLFDSTSDLKFHEGTKQAHTMISRDNEVVPLVREIDCSGQVEIWLNRVLDTMQATCRHELKEAVNN